MSGLKINGHLQDCKYKMRVKSPHSFGNQFYIHNCMSWGKANGEVDGKVGELLFEKDKNLNNPLAKWIHVQDFYIIGR